MASKALRAMVGFFPPHLKSELRRKESALHINDWMVGCEENQLERSVWSTFWVSMQRGPKRNQAG